MRLPITEVHTYTHRSAQDRTSASGRARDDRSPVDLERPARPLPPQVRSRGGGETCKSPQ
eukprot:4398906-Prymnesium_polylepis.1